MFSLWLGLFKIWYELILYTERLVLRAEKIFRYILIRQIPGENSLVMTGPKKSCDMIDTRSKFNLAIKHKDRTINSTYRKGSIPKMVKKVMKLEL